MKKFGLIGLGIVILVGVGVLARGVLLGGEDDGQPPVELRGNAIKPPLPIDDFSLTSTNGGDFTLSQNTGKLTLIYFGFLNCPDFCPNTLAKLTRVYQDLGEQAEQVQVIFITVDPERDTPELMARYVAAFDPSFQGLYGDISQTQEAMNRFGITAVRREVDSALGYLVDHTTTTYLLNQSGELAARYDYEVTYEDILHDVKVLLGQS